LRWISASAAHDHAAAAYKSVSVYARARRMQLKFDGSGQLLLHGKRI